MSAATDDEPVVKVTLRVIYDEVLAVKQDVAVIKSGSTVATVADHESRIRVLEKWIWRAAGIAAGVGAGGGLMLGEFAKGLGG